MTIGGKIFCILFFIALSVFGAIGCYGGIRFIMESTTLAGMECIKNLVGGFVLALISVAMLWLMGIAALAVVNDG